jgi:exosome complex exonuclease DIS3/RRP44
VRALGKIGDKSTENQVLLLEHDIPHSKFSEAVLDCLPQLPWIITPQVINREPFLTSPWPPGEKFVP